MGKPRDFLISHQEAADSYDEQQRLWEERQHKMDLLGEDARDEQTKWRWTDEFFSCPDKYVIGNAEPEDEEEP